MFFEKVKGPYMYWRSKEGYRIERRARGIYAIITPEGRVWGQASSLDIAIERAAAHEGRA